MTPTAPSVDALRFLAERPGVNERRRLYERLGDLAARGTLERIVVIPAEPCFSVTSALGRWQVPVQEPYQRGWMPRRRLHLAPATG